MFAITYVPTLDHGVHAGRGRRDAPAVLDEWMLGTGPDGPRAPEGSRTIS